MLKMRIAATVIGGLFATLVVGVPAPAHAGSTAYARLLTGSCGGSYGEARSYFDDVSEVFAAYDNCSDDHSAVTRWKIGSSATIFSVWDHSGAGGGNPATTAVAIPEGTTVRVQACTGEYATGAILSCTAWGTAGSVGTA